MDPIVSINAGGFARYRYGFQNQEVDNEIKGNGNSVNFKYRMHDPRLGRFFAVDLLSATYPYNSPYAFSENTVLNAIELEGLEKVFVYNKWTDGKGIVHTKYSHTYIDNDLKENLNRVNHYNSQGEIEKSQFKSGRKSGTTSATYSKNENISNNLYIQFESTTDVKKSRDQQNTESFVASGMAKDATRYDPMEGKRGARKFANGLELLGTGLQAFPLTAPLGKGLSLAGGAYNSAMDFQTYGTEKGIQNTGIRLITFGLGKVLDKGISKAGLDKNTEHVRKVGVDQALKQAEDTAIELNTSKE